MRKVLIVDDERNIRLGVKSILERKENSDYEIYLSSNGVEALELLESKQMDIVITDIRMPQMDGIVFIKELKKRKERVNIIILSGYDDFNYALEALKCGANDYLLKPLKREELYSCLDKIENIIKRNEEFISREKLISEYIEDFRANDLNSILMNDNISEDEFLSITKRTKLKILENSYYLVLLIKNDNIDRKKDMNIKQEMNLILENYPNGNKEQVITFFDWDKNLVMICENEKVVNYLSEKIMVDNKFKYSIAESSEATGIREIRKAYKEAQQALKYRIFTYYYDSVLIKYTDIANKNMEFSSEAEKIEKLCNMIGTDRKNEIETILFELVNENKVNIYDISYIEEINAIINKTIYEHIIRKFYSNQDNIIRRYEKLKDIYNFENYKEYLHELKDYITHVNEYIKTIKEIYGDKNKIEKAIEYMKKNYAKDLDLAIVSNEVSLNYSYFSQLFKEYTGDNFVNYLKRIRIDKAKELLIGNDFKVYEVAQRVGYPDSKQFAKTFRSIMGISPIEYREMNIKE
jgi:two-component system response regulator YesN